MNWNLQSPASTFLACCCRSVNKADGHRHTQTTVFEASVCESWETFSARSQTSKDLHVFFTWVTAGRLHSKRQAGGGRAGVCQQNLMQPSWLTFCNVMSSLQQKCVLQLAYEEFLSAVSHSLWFSCPFIWNTDILLRQVVNSADSAVQNVTADEGVSGASRQIILR
jgi:hypothetical protein